MILSNLKKDINELIDLCNKNDIPIDKVNINFFMTDSKIKITRNDIKNKFTLFSERKIEEIIKEYQIKALKEGEILGWGNEKYSTFIVLGN